MKLVFRALFSLVLFLFQVWVTEQKETCETPRELSGIISYRTPKDYVRQLSECWYIDPPDDSLVHLKFLSVRLDDPYCQNQYFLISGIEDLKVCPNDYKYSYEGNWTKTLIGAVSITFHVRYAYSYLFFDLEYKIENIVCFRKNHFRCSENLCINKHQVCDGVDDCEDGTDEIDCDFEVIRSVKVSRRNAISWLKSRQVSFGWGKNTHRAITALFLTGEAEFRGKNFQEEVMVKQLELQTMKSLLRNSTNHMSVNELSMYVNALSVTCHNPRNFYGYDFVKILAERAFSTSPSPAAYLTLCSAKWEFSRQNVQQMVDILIKGAEYPFFLEFQAMAVMALTCLKDKNRNFQSMLNVTEVYDDTIEHFWANKQPDGSFGSVHTTAIVAQALLSTGNVDRFWDSSSTMDYLVQNLNSSSVDFLSIYLALPLFRNKSLVDIGKVDCSNYQRKFSEDDEIADVMHRLGGKIHVQYSLHVGDTKDVIHTIQLKIPENSSVYDVMRVAEVADPKYKFSYVKRDGHVYIYKLAGIANDIEVGKFWILYTENSKKVTEFYYNTSPDKIVIENKQHLIMWYKTVHI